MSQPNISILLLLTSQKLTKSIITMLLNLISTRINSFHKAELEILTTEVAGLQRELATSLEALEDSEKRAREYRDMASNLKHKLRNTTSTVTELKVEAEARDKLIDTFSRILLQKVGVEGDAEGSMDSSARDSRGELGEEKMGENLDMMQAQMKTE